MYKCYCISCHQYFFYSGASFSPSRLPKYCDCAKNRCVTVLMSSIINDLWFWTALKHSTFAGLCWLLEGVSPCPLCPSFHTQALHDIPLHMSHSHLCLRLRHSSNFLPGIWVETKYSHRERVDCVQGSSPRACGNLAPFIHHCTAVVFQGELAHFFLEPDSFSLIGLEISCSTEELSLNYKISSSVKLERINARGS